MHWLRNEILSHTVIKKTSLSDHRSKCESLYLISRKVEVWQQEFYFSESYRPPPPGSLCGSWPQPPPCSRRGSCACPSSDGVHRRDSHSGSRTLTKQTSAHQNVYGEIASELWCVWTRWLCSPVRPTFLRHMKHLFFLGLRASGVLVSSPSAVFGGAVDAVGWVTTGKTVTRINSWQTTTS